MNSNLSDQFMDNKIVVPPDRAHQEHQFPQGSLYNLTFDQLGNVGKPLNTTAMKLDELMLLKNVISVEEGQVLQNINNPCSSSSCSSSSSSASSSFFLGNFDLNGLSSSRKKSVDEVWKDIVQDQDLDNNLLDNQSTIHHHQQLGETTLEDFLVRAGVINLANNQNAMLNNNLQQIMAIDPMVAVSQQQADWLQQLQMAAMQRQQVLDSNFHVSESSVYDQIIDARYSDNQLGMTMPVTVTAMSATSSSTTTTITATASSESQAAAEKKSRYLEQMMEKTIERRQKRMIKNRESASRSRARKQAYTNHLEHEVFQLRKTNTWLKKLKEVETILSDTTPMPRYQLRRTSSALF